MHAQHGRMQLNELSDNDEVVDDVVVNKKVRVAEVKF